MKKRDDLYARAAYVDIHNGLHMALKGASELLSKEQHTDCPTDEHPAVKALEKIALRVAKAARRRVTVRIDDEIDTSVYIGDPS